MKAQNLKKYSHTNWEKLSTMSDTSINTSDIQELDPSFFANATLKLPEPKKAISLRLDPDVLSWYKKQGSGYQTRINAVLRFYMQAKHSTGKTTRKPVSRRRRPLKHA